MAESDNVPEQNPGPGSSRPSENRTTSGGPRASGAGESLAPGTLIDHRFTLTRLIGRGGMGVVWEAHDTSLGREVALKFLGNEVAADPEAVADLQRETRRSLELTHPNIVRVYDYVEDQELRLVGISMELLTGRSLQMLKLDQPQRAFTPDKVLPWLRQICVALDYAHQIGGVVHRDLKPGNLFLNDKGTVKIVDFGIAMVMRDSTSRLVQEARLSRSGTLAYMSQQQLRGDKPAPSDDLYSLGALLYELFTSKPPFFRGDAQALMMQIMSQSPMPIAERQVEMGVKDNPVPPAWEKVIMACLSKDAAARPGSGGELLSLIEKGQAAALDFEPKPQPDSVLEATKVVDHDSTRLANPTPVVSDPEKTMLAGRVPTDDKTRKVSAPPPLPPVNKGTTPQLPPKIPPQQPPKLPPEKKAAVVPPVAPKPQTPPPQPPKDKKPVEPDPLRRDPTIVIHHNPDDKDKDKKKGGWGWLGMIGELLGLKSAVVAGILLLATGVLGWLRSNGSQGLVIKIEPTDAAAQVSLDGRPVDRNPAPSTLKLKGLSEGAHHVSVIAKGYKGQEFETLVKDGHGEADVKLERESGVVAMNAPPGSKVTIEPADGGKSITRDVGPDGRVEFDDLPVGKANVKVESPNHEPQVRDVDIQPDVKQTLNATLAPLPATINVKTDPAGAQILVNGRSQGLSPKSFPVPAETNLTIETRLDGYEPERITRRFEANKSADVPIQLRQQHGNIVIHARPGTAVTAQHFGASATNLGTVGSSGTSTFSLTPGQWYLQFDNPDCQRVTRENVSVTASRPVDLPITQTLLPGELEVHSNPEGATVIVNGQTRSTTPYTDNLASETRLTVEVRLRGRPLGSAQTVTLQPGKKTPLFFEQKEPEALTAKLDLQPWNAIRGHRIDISVNNTHVTARQIKDSVFEVPLDNNSSNQYNVHVEIQGFRDQMIWADPTPDARPTVVRFAEDTPQLAEKIWISSPTVGARIYLNNAGPFPSPYVQQNLKPGPYTIKVDAPGYLTETRQVTLAPGENKLVDPIVLSPAHWPGERPSNTNNPYSYNNYNNGQQPQRQDIVPADADAGGSVNLKPGLSMQQITQAIRGVAAGRKWTVSRIENNVAVLQIKSGGTDATVYIRFDSHHIELFSDSYRSGGLLSSGSAKKFIPSGWVKNLQGDLTKAIGTR